MVYRIQNGSPRNTAISPDRTESVSKENGVNFPDREVLIEKRRYGKLNGEIHRVGQKLVISLVFSIHVLMEVRYVVLSGCIDIVLTYRRFTPANT